MIVIGADAHKRSHMLAAVDAGTGLLVAELEIRANEDGHRRMLRWARGLAGERVWAIEDCRGLTGRLEQALLGAGERVVRVPPKLMGASRRGERQPGKSDEIDARAIARAVLREGIDRFPAAFLDECALEIRLRRALSQRRSLRPPGRRRTDTRLIGATPSPPTAPRRRSPAQQGAAHHRHRPRATGPEPRAYLERKHAESKTTAEA